MKRIALVVVVVVGVGAAACGDDGGKRVDADAVDVGADGADGDGADAVEDSTDAVADTTPDADDAVEDTTPDAPDAVEDTTPDAPDLSDASDATDSGEVDAGPHACAELEACDELLAADGTCPGACHAADDALRCKGAVVAGVCHNLPPGDATTEEIDFGDFTVSPVDVPDTMVVGQSASFALALRNDTAAAIVVPFAMRDPGTFTFADASWEGSTSFHLGAHATAQLTATITATMPTVLSFGPGLIASFVFDGNVYEARTTVGFAPDPSAPPDSVIACGGQSFPATYCPDDNCYAARDYYTTARCCDDVFFPGAQCCDDGDCQGDAAFGGDVTASPAVAFGGACVDGKCVVNAPSFVTANNVPLGHQTIRLVLTDDHPQFADDPCADHYDDVKGEIDFATVEGWYDAMAARRLGRNAVDFRWVVTGGVATSDFLTGSNQWPDYARELNDWLAARGCPIFDSYDKVIVKSTTVDLYGFGGYYMGQGMVAVSSTDQAYLLAHELGHSFGANDLYLDLAGPFLYPLDLMGNYLATPPDPGDGVGWGEMGYGDVDRDGVIDVVEYAAYPVSIAVANATATISAKGTFTLRFELVARDADAGAGSIDKRVVVAQYHLKIPAANIDFDVQNAARWKTTTLDGTQIDIPALESAGAVDVSVDASYRFTDAAWVFRTLHATETLHVPITHE